MEFHFTSNAGYVDGVHQRGEAVQYDEADAMNLSRGGSGHVAANCPGASCPSVKAGFASATKEPKNEPAGTNGATDPAANANAGTGSNGAANGSNDPAAFTCADCGGKAFATEAALKAHIRAKHPQLNSVSKSDGGALVPPEL